MSNEHDEIRARYEAAVKAWRLTSAFSWEKRVPAALADIPRLLEEISWTDKQWSDCITVANERQGELFRLRAQLAERDAEVERLEGILQSATETFTAAQLGKESQIESLSTENKRLREALTELQVVAQESYERTSTNCRKRRERLSSALRRAGEAMEEKGDDFYIVVEKGNTRNIYDDKGLVRSEEKGEQGDEQV